MLTGGLTATGSNSIGRRFFVSGLKHLLWVLLSSCDNPERLASHLGLFHKKLDEYLSDSSFVAEKRRIYHATKRPQPQAANPAQAQCLICDVSMARPTLRKHCADHFTQELEAVVEEVSPV